jgi:hypothetical protein
MKRAAIAHKRTEILSIESRCFHSQGMEPRMHTHTDAAIQSPRWAGASRDGMGVQRAAGRVTPLKPSFIRVPSCSFVVSENQDP